MVMSDKKSRAPAPEAFNEHGNVPTMAKPQTSVASPTLSEDSPQVRFRYLPELMTSEKQNSEKQTHSPKAPMQVRYTPPPEDRPPPYHSSTVPHPPAQSSSSNQNVMSIHDTDPAPSFSRQPSPNVPYTSFPLMYLTANGKHLDKGFPLVPPPTPVAPHPFVTHDVNEDDWHRFLNDVKKAGRLTGREQMAAATVPITTHMPLIGVLASSAMASRMKKEKVIPVRELINTWNHLFFHPRRMEVTLVKGFSDNVVPVSKRRRSPSSSVSSESSSESVSNDCQDGNPWGNVHREMHALKREILSFRREIHSFKKEVYKVGREVRKAEREVHKMKRKTRRVEREVHKAERKEHKEQLKAEKKNKKKEESKKYQLLVAAWWAEEV